ncbi:MAG TPA: T9SS type A sorting domain-containing protein [Edaphocola sp.]|nr:T9SS type A sorting domain-containing protein [Edaphocola sp.]
MKKVLLMLLCWTFLGQSSFGQSSVFEPPVTFEDYYPFSDEPLRSNNSSAYSCENQMINGVNSDIFVWNWDHFKQPYPSGGIIGSGLAVRQDTISGFVQSANPTGFPVDDASSVEAAFIKRNDSVFVIATYYRPSLQKFFLDLYYFQSGTNIIQMPGYPMDITASPFGTAHIGWIHLDVRELEEYVIVWDEDGTLYTKAGEASTNTLGNTAILDNSLIGISYGSQPDVALIRSIQNGGVTNAHFVYTDNTKTKLFVSSLKFNDILTASFLGSLYPHLEDFQGGGVFERPRIDAPDKLIYDDWTYVVLKENYIDQQQIIFTGVMNNGLGTLNHYNLNDGSMASLTDISSTAPGNLHINEQPVVAYNFDGDYLYYCWNYSSSVNMPSADSSEYIGLKMKNDGTVVPISGTPTTYKYWVASEQLSSPSAAFSIALSTKNENNHGLFMAYVRYKDFFSIPFYCMAIKTNPWALQSFKPGNNQQNDAKEDDLTSISIIPNPFTVSFNIHTNEIEYKNNYSLELHTILGKQILSLRGNIQFLNQELRNSSLSKIPSGIYLLTIKDATNKIYQFKLIKN